MVAMTGKDILMASTIGKPQPSPLLQEVALDSLDSCVSVPLMLIRMDMKYKRDLLKRKTRPTIEVNES